MTEIDAGSVALLNRGADDHGAVSPLRRWPVVALWGILGLATLLRLQEIQTVSYWFDESSSWKTIQFTWPEMFDSIRRNAHPPAYYCLLRIWACVWGDDPVALRAFSTMFGILTIVAAARFMREAIGAHYAGDLRQADGAVLFACTLLALSPVQVALSLQARMYTLGTFLAVVGATALLRICRRGGTVCEWIIWTASTLLLTLTHYYGLFTAGAFVTILVGRMIHEAGTGGLTSMLKRKMTGYFLATWTGSLAWSFWLPAFQAQHRRVNGDYWIPDLTRQHVADVCTTLLTGNDLGAQAWLPPELGLAILATVAVCSLLCEGCPSRVCGLALALPIVLAVGLSNQRNILVWRYLVFSQIFLLLGWALFVARLQSTALRLVLIVMSVGWFGFWSAAHWRSRAWIAEAPGFRQAARMIDDSRTAGTPVLVSASTMHPVIQRYSSSPADVFVADRGYEYAHYLGGPLLRPTEYLSVQKLTQGPANRVFVVGAQRDLDLGHQWREVRSVEYEERASNRRRITVRELVRSDRSKDGSS